MDFERRLNQIVGCPNGGRMEAGGDLSETNTKKLRDLRGAKSPFLSGLKYGI